MCREQSCLLASAPSAQKFAWPAQPTPLQSMAWPLQQLYAAAVVCCLLFVVCCLLAVVCCLLFAVGALHVLHVYVHALCMLLNR